jgi:hypothetical protein
LLDIGITETRKRIALWIGEVCHLVTVPSGRQLLIVEMAPAVLQVCHRTPDARYPEEQCAACAMTFPQRCATAQRQFE